MKIQTPNPQTLEVSDLTEITAANALHVRDSIRAELKRSHTTLNLDLSTVTFLDSSGLGLLISLHKTLRKRHGTMRLIRPSSAAYQVIELTRLHRMFEIVT